MGVGVIARSSLNRAPLPLFTHLFPSPCPPSSSLRLALRFVSEVVLLSLAACALASIAPLPCLPGTYASSRETYQCSLCEAGRFQPEGGATACVPCEPGFYCPEGSSSPLPCNKGSYGARPSLEGGEECELCPVGSFCITGSSIPTPCSKGSFAASEGQSECTPCEGGTYQAENGASSCEECPLGLFCPPGSSNPIGCESGADIPFAVTDRIGAESASDCVCKEGYYDDGSQGNQRCKECPSGSRCLRRGVTLASLPLQPGYFRLHPSTEDIHRCPDSSTGCGGSVVCEESFSGCAGTGGTRNGSATVASRRLEVAMGVPFDPETPFDSGCREGLTGVFCMLCDSNSSRNVYYFKATDSEAASCKDCNLLVIASILAVFGLIAGLWGCLHALTLLTRRQSAYVQIQLHNKWRKYGVHIKLKVLVGFYLIATVVHKVYEVEIPIAVFGVLEFFSGFISFGFSGMESVLQCLGFRSYMAYLAVHMITPAVVAICILIRGAFLTRSVEGMLELTSAPLLYLLFLSYPIVTRVAFDGFSCFSFEESEWLKADVSIQCHTEQHASVEALASLAIAIYPVGLLLLVAFLLFKSRKAIRSNTPSRLSAAISFLHREYKPHLFWWELVEMLRRFVLVGLMVLYQDTIMQLLLGSLLCAIFLLLQVKPSPSPSSWR